MLHGGGAYWRVEGKGSGEVDEIKGEWVSPWGKMQVLG